MIVAGRADDRRISRYRNPAELIPIGSITRYELLLLCPGRSRTHEGIRRAGVDSARNVVRLRNDDYCVPRHRDTKPELILISSITRHELLLLYPGRSRTHEHVRGPMIFTNDTREIVTECPDNHAVTIDRDREPELIPGRGIARDKLLLLNPRAAGTHEDVRSPGVDTTRQVLAKELTDEERARYNDAAAKQLTVV